jgi:cyclohexa-1,5-dienecarbonyl-CoA hydratase
VSGFVVPEQAHGGAVLRLRFHHPTGNLLTRSLVSALREALTAAPSSALKMIVLEGAGQDFSFGASIPEHAPGEIEYALPEFHRLVLDLLDVPAVTAAAVRGRCLGGGFELALACDFVFAAPDATFGLPEIGLGVFPPAASMLLPARVGQARATAAVLRGDPLTADEWQRAGLIEEVAEDVEQTIDDWFSRHLATRSPAALRFAAQAVRYSLRERVHASLGALEQLYLGELMATHDAAEGIAAFLQKRTPEWSGE